MSPIADNLKRVHDRIAAACKAAGRSPSEVRLVAVCKTFPASDVREVAGAGQKDFGENRLQDAESKIDELKDLGLRWHFLGQIQSNKLNRILERFDVIQSFDRVELLEKAEAFLASRNLTRDALLEVHISGESTKSGFDPVVARALFKSGDLKKYRRLNIRGLMGIAPHTDDRAKVRASFDLLKTLYDEARTLGHPYDTLSMGMSADLEEAITSGTTLVRVGTAIFGSRSV